MTILVTGATGNVGSAVVHDLLRSGASVRVLTRDPERARRILGEQPEIVGGELTHTDVLDTALDGVDRMFLASGNHPEQVAAECAAIDAAAASSVGRLVKLSGPAPDLESPLFIERWHAQIEAHLRASGLRAVALRPASFMTNLMALADPVAQAGILPAPTQGARVAFVDPRDVGSVAATLLTAGQLPEGDTLRVTGPAAVTYADVAAAISGATGRPVTFVPVPEQDARAAMLAAGVPGFLAEAFLTVYGMQRDGAFAAVADTVPALLGRPARSVADFVSENRALFTSAVGAVPA